MEYFYGFSAAASKLNLGIGRNIIFDILIEKGLIDKDHKPKQDLLDAGYMKFEYKEKYLGSTYKKIRYGYLTICDNGLIWLEEVLKQHISK